MRVCNMNRAVSSQVQVLQFSARPTLGHRQGGWRSLLRSQICRVTDRYLEYQYSHPLILGTSYLLYRLGMHSDIFVSPILRWLSPPQLRRVMRDASIIQVEHPWLFKVALRLADGRPIVYIAHNVEAQLWEGLESKQSTPFPKLARRPRELEREAVQRASAIVAMSTIDAEILISEYGANPARICVIPNGVDLDTRRPATPEDKTAARSRLGLDDRPMLLFLGSDHYPNREALGHIERWQAQLGPELGVQFVVVGTVGQGGQSTEYMRVEGFVESVDDYLMAADVALNPLTSGSGTSLKVVEYLACSLPTITTSTGVRGLEFVPGRDVLLGDVSDFPGLIRQVLSDQGLGTMLSRNGRRTVEQKYGWERLGNQMLGVYERTSSCGSA